MTEGSDAANNLAAIRALSGMGQAPAHYDEATGAELAKERAGEADPPQPSPASGVSRPTITASQQQQSTEVDARSRRHYRFDLEYRDADGKLWQGQFLSVLPNIRQDIEIARRIAKMTHVEGGLPAATQTTIYALCFMEQCLVERPEWARDIGELVEPQLFDALAQEVHAHLDTFQRRRQRA